MVVVVFEFESASPSRLTEAHDFSTMEFCGDVWNESGGHLILSKTSLLLSEHHQVFSMSPFVKVHIQPHDSRLTRIFWTLPKDSGNGFIPTAASMMRFERSSESSKITCDCLISRFADQNTTSRHPPSISATIAIVTIQTRSQSREMPNHVANPPLPTQTCAGPEETRCATP